MDEHRGYAVMKIMLIILMTASISMAAYDEFRHPSPNNTGLYVCIEGPAALIETHVPTNVANCWVTSTDADGNTVTNGTKVLVDYLTMPPVYSVDSNSVVILLNEKYDPRMTSVAVSDIAAWDTNLSAYGLGYASGGWMGLDGSPCTNKVSDLLQSERYARDEEL